MDGRKVWKGWGGREEGESGKEEERFERLKKGSPVTKSRGLFFVCKDAILKDVPYTASTQPPFLHTPSEPQPLLPPLLLSTLSPPFLSLSILPPPTFPPSAPLSPVLFLSVFPFQTLFQIQTSKLTLILLPDLTLSFPPPPLSSLDVPTRCCHRAEEDCCCYCRGLCCHGLCRLCCQAHLPSRHPDPRHVNSQWYPHSSGVPCCVLCVCVVCVCVCNTAFTLWV